MNNFFNQHITEKIRCRYRVLSLVFILFSAHTIAQEVTRLLRFPDIHRDKIVFSYAGDLYIASDTGGTARKITTHNGYEMFARFSPDGKHIAFTGHYDGNREVYLVSSKGGKPKRLTYSASLSRDKIGDRMGPNNIVMTWTPNGEKIVYRSRQTSFNPFAGHLNMVSKDGGMPEQIPLSEGGFCSYSPDGKQLAFNRVFREFRTWKRYKGGMADDIHIFDIKKGFVQTITDNVSQDIFPMWIKTKIYFLSDRDGTMNLYAYDTTTKKTNKITFFKDFDIKFPAHDENRIIFEKGGDLFTYNVGSGKIKKLSIIIANDLQFSRNNIKDASKRITGADLSPGGKRVIFSARGELFSVPEKSGVTYNFSNTPGVHERDAVYSPDGRHIAFISDKTGEYEIYIQHADGSEEPKQVTQGNKTYIFSVKWSPDSKKLLWNDRKLRLHYVDIEEKETFLVHQSETDVIHEFNWSPDSKWIAFQDHLPNKFGQVSIYNIDTKLSKAVTDYWHNSGYPAFSDDGKCLIFVSQRYFSPTYSQTEWNHAYTKMSSIYLILLDENTVSPFKYKNDKVLNPENDKKDDKEAGNTSITFENITERTIHVPVPPSNYFNLTCVEGKIYYSDYAQKSIDMGMYDINNQKNTTIGNSMMYSLSADRKKMFVRQGKSFYIVPLPQAPLNLDESVDVSGLKAEVDYREEWQQVFDESWRQMRDFFYDPNMHGVNWQAVHDKYAELVLHVNHRDDLTYLIGEMIGELNSSHTYVNTGQKPKPEKIKTGMLGAEIEQHESGYFKVKHVLPGNNWDKSLRSPLSEPGVGINKGDFIIAVNGQSVKNTNNLYSLLVGKAGEKVELTYNSSPFEKNAKKAVVVPVSEEAGLYYHQWIQNNIKRINEATDGQVGYVHIPDMGTRGLNSFVKYYYPQLDKKGLIIDNRGNGGGNVSPMIIERLQREVIRSRMARNSVRPFPVPMEIMLGPKVLLVDKYSASDGDLFTYAFKKFDMGKVIGERTWGGVIGINSSLPFMDGSSLRKPEFASFSSESSQWIIEGHGVDPDINVENDPHKQYNGYDTQLETAIDEVLKEMAKNPREIPAIPEFPDKSK